jgi:hypothetical protein
MLQNKRSVGYVVLLGFALVAAFVGPGIGDDQPRKERPRDRAEKSETRRDSDREFRPQTEREAQLYRMILELRADVAELKRQVQRTRGSSRDGDRQPARREGDAPESRARRDGDRAEGRDNADRDRPASSGRRNSKVAKIFAAYDKSKDEKVGFEEWLAMREGEIDDARRAREQGYFSRVDRNRDKTLSYSEFEYWMTKGRSQPEGRKSERGEGDRDAPRKRREK